MEHVLVGQVERVVYRAEGKSFAVAVVRLPGGASCTVTGPLAGLQPGVRYRFQGRWIRHPRRGRQFRCTAFAPALASGEQFRDLLVTSVRGVGEELAQQILDTLGPHALEEILASPNALTRVPGVGPRRAAAIREQLIWLVAEQDLAQRLAPFGLHAGHAARLLAVYGHDAWDSFLTDPYAAARALGKRWAEADRWAAQLGRSAAHFGRLRGALREVLAEALADGHVCLPRDEALLRVYRLLHGPQSAFPEPVPMALVLEQARWMLDVDRSLVERAGHWFLPAMDLAEEQAARHLRRLSAPAQPLAAAPLLDRVLAGCTAALGIQLA
ncbi:MAG TPA: helix-hairpin-helix domain-containing protein, partial [Thermaerobacter sp.]